MVEKTIEIKRGQVLSDILPNKEIPTNTILNKTLTGCGATYGEIVHAKRHSIIIEPNVPVILGKKAEHPFLFAVYEGITKEDVKAYLAGEHDGYRKIITTPEGFDKKVLPAMYETHTPMYDDYFLLLDECEKTIQDVGYRGDIYLPVEDFFRFKNKAMVSATPILPSDPRFEEQNFEMVRIAPTYDYRRPLTLCVTNNTVRILRKLLVRLKDETVCIFINSTDTILGLIQTLKLEGRCKVFCADKSVRKLKQQNFTDVSDRLSELAGVNFFTSRFYSAVDIKLDYKPHVIVLTDVFHAPYSMIDPQTEVVQAIGRFRNGIEQAYHITNTCDRLQSVSRDKLFHNLECQERIYNRIRELPIEGEIEHQTLTQALQGMDYKRFVTRTGNRNWFMWDNAYDDERVKQYYTDAELVREEYAKAFHTDCAEHIYPLSDCDRLQRINPRLKMKDLFREIVRQLEILEQNRTWNEYYFLREEIQSQVPMMVDAYYALGAAEIERHNYNMNAIGKQIQENESQQLLTSEKVCGEVYDRLKTGDKLPVCAVNRFMNDLIMRFGIPYRKKVTAKMIGIYFEYRDVRTNKQRFIELGKRII